MNNAQKTPLAKTLPNFMRRMALEEIAQIGLGLPGRVESVSGAIVTVAFSVSGLTLPQVTMPLSGSEYVRIPVKAGDLGFAASADYYLGGVSGLGGGTADTTPRGNLSCMVWYPIGSKNWSSVDPNAVTCYGPNGVVLRDTDSGSVATIAPDGITLQTPDMQVDSSGIVSLSADTSITLSAGGHTLVLNAAGLTIDGIVFSLHTHGGVTTGTGLTGSVTP